MDRPFPQHLPGRDGVKGFGASGHLFLKKYFDCMKKKSRNRSTIFFLFTLTVTDSSTIFSKIGREPTQPSLSYAFIIYITLVL